MADISICDHALQHVPDYAKAFRELARVTRFEGHVAICVYSWENNFVMTHLIEPSKTLIHMLPLKAQRLLAFPLVVMVFVLIHGIYAPVGKMSSTLGKKLILFDHMIFWSTFQFSVLWISIFDLIHAPVSHHFNKSEIEELSSDNRLVVSQLANTNETLWSLVALKPK